MSFPSLNQIIAGVTIFVVSTVVVNQLKNVRALRNLL